MIFADLEVRREGCFAVILRVASIRESARRQRGEAWHGAFRRGLSERPFGEGAIEVVYGLCWRRGR